jgi:hypothetical protein
MGIKSMCDYSTQKETAPIFGRKKPYKQVYQICNYHSPLKHVKQIIVVGKHCWEAEFSATSSHNFCPSLKQKYI